MLVPPEPSPQQQQRLLLYLRIATARPVASALPEAGAGDAVVVHDHEAAETCEGRGAGGISFLRRRPGLICGPSHATASATPLRCPATHPPPPRTCRATTCRRAQAAQRAWARCRGSPSRRGSTTSRGASPPAAAEGEKQGGGVVGHATFPHLHSTLTAPARTCTPP